MPRIKAVLAMTPEMVPFVFGEQELQLLKELVDLDPHRILTWEEGREPDLEGLANVELLLSGWGAPYLGASQLERLPALRGVVHWGGGVGFLDRSAREREIAVSSARAANGIPVAEFTAAMITFAAKDVIWVSRDYCRDQRFINREAELPHTGLYGTTVGLVGASTIGMLVIEQLRDRDVKILVYDPYLTESAAACLGVELVRDLEDLARRSSILSVHAPVTSQTEGMISRRVLAALPDGATFVNTARGVLVDQDALVDELAANRIRAILDVTEPEVLPEGHPLYTLPNVFLTPHLAGSTGVELRRLGHAALAEVERFVFGDPFAHPFPLP
ncbi:phosphoglycerate dehydrogenase-like enzyme [Microbacterium foliorum]|uniref:Phosphoglycerate dehydrogenase-like enzyme n=1 Tax=Microbacterium foliorum TaxID=104336 RepID=A0ABU1HVI0_9MICO|nr:hydroxyacid dehydrogenase [Microbacterium foliorum]MDR6144058.1 phosphoglycerate dehydrogenase-like enzyme [Microbacterium foliorum]